MGEKEPCKRTMGGCRVNVLKFVWFALRPPLKKISWVAKMTSFSPSEKNHRTDRMMRGGKKRRRIELEMLMMMMRLPSLSASYLHTNNHRSNRLYLYLIINLVSVQNQLKLKLQPLLPSSPPNTYVSYFKGHIPLEV